MSKFQAGDAPPVLEGETVAHGHLKLPEAIPSGNWGVILAYRANW